MQLLQPTNSRTESWASGLAAPLGPDFVVEAHGESLLGALVAAFVVACYPEVSVEIRSGAESNATCVSVFARVNPNSRLFIFFGEPEIGMLAGFAVSGRWGLLTASSREDEFRAALNSLQVDGPPFIASALVQQLAAASLQGPLAGAGLTLRETQVLAWLNSGCSNREIADRLVVSPNTVRAHLQSISTKLGVSGRSRLTAEARRRGLLQTGM